MALRFVDNFGKVTETYPANPNGSPNGITAVTSESGRATIMMPHPERVFRTVSNSWHPENWGEDSPWMRIFRNARKQLGYSSRRASRERISPLPDRGLFFICDGRHAGVSGIADNCDIAASPIGDT